MARMVASTRKGPREGLGNNATNTSASTPEILFTQCDTLSPEKLSRADFDNWEITQHIPLVLTTGKEEIGTAKRYQHITYSSSLPSNPLDASQNAHKRLGFLTVYGLKGVKWMESRAVKSLEKEHEEPYQATVFRNAEFDSRIYSSVAMNDFKDSNFNGPEERSDESQIQLPAPIILTIFLSGHPGSRNLGSQSEQDVRDWFSNDHLPFFNSISGYRTSRIYRLRHRALPSRLKTSNPSAPGWLIVHDFDGLRIPGIGFRDVEEEMARLKEGIRCVPKHVGGCGDMEGDLDFAFWSLMGEYWCKDL